jgi:F0F1-type ATP synthase assembly protein I
MKTRHVIILSNAAVMIAVVLGIVLGWQMTNGGSLLLGCVLFFLPNSDKEEE